MNMGKRQEYSIGEAARAAGVSAKTIRYYEHVGLIPKARRRSGPARTGGDCVYDEADIGRLRFIRHARMVDLALSDVRELLKISEVGCPSKHPKYAEVLRRQVRSIEERINHLLATQRSTSAFEPAQRRQTGLLHLGNVRLHECCALSRQGDSRCV
jgi:DNA-binding transcriptional MerR regulator